PANLSKVKAKLARLETSPDATLALPGPGLTLPTVETAAPSPKVAKAEPMLPLPGFEAPPGSGLSARDKAVPPPLPLPGVTEAQRLLESERQNKTLSFVGFAGGLAAAGIATALFAF